MALLTRAEVKAYLKVETDLDDPVLDRLLLGARALVTTYLRRPLDGAGVGTVPSETWQGVSSARGPGVDPVTTISAGPPLTEEPGYTTLVEPVLNDVLMDLVADRWHRRNPAVASESAAGDSVSYDTSSALPKRAEALLRRWRA